MELLRRPRLLALSLAAVATAGVALARAESEVAPESATRSTRPPKRAVVRPANPGARSAEGADSLASLERKAEEAIANDQRILARFDQIMSELQVVKIRVLRAPQVPPPPPPP